MIDGTPLSYTSPTYLSERIPYIKRGVASAITRIETAISVLKERLEDSGELLLREQLTLTKGLIFIPRSLSRRRNFTGMVTMRMRSRTP